MANPTPLPLQIHPDTFVGVIDELDDETARPWAPTKKDTPKDAKRTAWTEELQNSNFTA